MRHVIIHFCSVTHFPEYFRKGLREERKDVVNLELFLLNTDLFVGTMHIEREERGEMKGDSFHTSCYWDHKFCKWKDSDEVVMWSTISLKLAQYKGE